MKTVPTQGITYIATAMIQQETVSLETTVEINQTLK